MLKMVLVTVNLKGHTLIEGGVIGAMEGAGAGGEDTMKTVGWTRLYHIIGGPEPGVDKASTLLLGLHMLSLFLGFRP